MKIKPASLLREISDKLSIKNDEREAKAIAMILLQEYLSIDRAKLMINDELVIADNTLLSINRAVERLKNQEPIQHIIGSGHFYGRDFKVSPSVLIPRPETEELVDLIIKTHQNSNFSLIDIGTGSGCIPISVAKELSGCSAVGLDVSPHALAIAKENAKKLNAEVSFIELDILNELPEGQFDVVVSNPPYITDSEKSLMHANVLEFEPELALFVPDRNPLLFYNRIAEVCQSILKQGGYLYFEINEHYGEETKSTLDQKGFEDTKIIKDLNDKDRIVLGRLK